LSSSWYCSMGYDLCVINSYSIIWYLL